MTTIAWALNLEADLELASPRGFAPSPRLLQQAATQARRFLEAAEQWAPAGVRHEPVQSGRRATACQSWCPTPRAVAAAEAAGHTLPPSPPLAVLQRVNHRSFAASLGNSLPGAAFVSTMTDLDAVLAANAPARGWLLKRPFGFSGRGRKHVRSALDAGDRRWAAASMVDYGCGLQVEPFVDIECEFALHSWLGPNGDCLTGQVTSLESATDGSWIASRRLDDATRNALLDHEREQLMAAHAATTQALAAKGYFGPFAIDAFRWRDAAGRPQFQPLSELNARYTMGFFAGLGELQDVWLLRIRHERDTSKKSYSSPSS